MDEADENLIGTQVWINNEKIHSAFPPLIRARPYNHNFFFFM
jgi:hypothetical protein